MSLQLKPSDHSVTVPRQGYVGIGCEVVTDVALTAEAKAERFNTNP